MLNTKKKSHQYTPYISSKTCDKTCELLLLEEEVEDSKQPFFTNLNECNPNIRTHYVLIKDFNKLMYYQSKCRNRKYF